MMIVMAGFGLPADPAHVCLVLVTMGTVGLLPLGIGWVWRRLAGRLPVPVPEITPL